jgi:predicted outer membrane protein
MVSQAIRFAWRGLLRLKSGDNPMKKYLALAALTASLATPVAAQTAVQVAVPTDREGFRMMAMMSDAFEITSSQLALERSRNPRVLSYARNMIRDHAMTSQALNGGAPVYAANGSAAGGAVTGTLAGAGIGALVGGPVGAAVGAGIGASAGAASAAPSTAGGTATGALAGAGVGALVGGPVGAAVGAGVGATTGATAGAVQTTGSVNAASIRTAVPLDARKQAMLAQLASTSGPTFDRLYGQMQRMAHQEALAVYTGYSQNGSDPAMVNFARSVIPHLQSHLAMSRSLPGAR